MIYSTSQNTGSNPNPMILNAIYVVSQMKKGFSRRLKWMTTCPLALVYEVKVMHKEQALFEGAET